VIFEWDDQKAANNLKGCCMKKGDRIDEIKPVDFSGGVRGKHSESYRRGHTGMALV